MSTNNILFFKDWLRRGSWHRLAQTQACRRHQSLEVWRQQLLSLTGYRTRLFKYFSSGKPDPYRAPFAPKHELVCVVQEKESWRHWFAPANRTKESKITFSGGCFKRRQRWNTALLWTQQELIYQLCINFFTSHLPTMMQTLSDCMLLQMCVTAAEATFVCRIIWIKSVRVSQIRHQRWQQQQL